MTIWAMLSGIEGNLAAYEAVLADLKRRSPIDELYILGDLVGATPESETLVQRVRSPRRGELEPQVCAGWWEEQCFILHGVSSQTEAPELIAKYGGDTVKRLWDCVPRETVQWLRSLNFGFFELDSLLIHGSTVGVDDELTPKTSPVQMLDRLMRSDANNLFCGRSGLAFEYELEQGKVTVAVKTLDRQQEPVVNTVSPRRVIGVGNVGRSPGKATYTLYDPGSNHVEFKTIRYGGRGFQSSYVGRSAQGEYKLKNAKRISEK
jgi:hypothetical protein